MEGQARRGGGGLNRPSNPTIMTPRLGSATVQGPSQHALRPPRALPQHPFPIPGVNGLSLCQSFGAVPQSNSWSSPRLLGPREGRRFRRVRAIHVCQPQSTFDVPAAFSAGHSIRRCVLTVRDGCAMQCAQVRQGPTYAAPDDPNGVPNGF